MLISLQEIQSVLSSQHIPIEGILHIGAFNCEELPIYNELGISKEQIIWVEAIPSKVYQALHRGIPTVYNAVITNTDNESILFNIANNIHSSSLLQLGTHLQELPSVKYVDRIRLTTTTLDSFFTLRIEKPNMMNFWKIAVQGAEWLALQGARNSLSFAKVIYLTVYETERYIGCKTISEIDNFLLPYNFTRMLTNWTQHGWGEALYITNKTI